MTSTPTWFYHNLIIKELSEGTTQIEIGKMIGKSPATIHNYVKDHNLFVYDNLNYKNFIIDELSKGTTQKEIANMVGKTTKTINHYISTHKLTTRGDKNIVIDELSNTIQKERGRTIEDYIKANNITVYNNTILNSFIIEELSKGTTQREIAKMVDKQLKTIHRYIKRHNLMIYYNTNYKDFITEELSKGTSQRKMGKSPRTINGYIKRHNLLNKEDMGLRTLANVVSE